MGWKELFEYVIKPLSKNYRSDLVTAAALIAGSTTGEISLPEELAASDTVKKVMDSVALEGNVKERALKILENTKDKNFRTLLEDVFKNFITSTSFSDMLTAMSMNASFLNVLRNAFHALSMLKIVPEEELRSYLDKISGYLDELEGFVSYYRVPKNNRRNNNRI